MSEGCVQPCLSWSAFKVMSLMTCEGFGDSGMKRTSRLAQQRAVGRIPLQHAAFLVVDLVRTIEAIITSQPFDRRRGGEHAIGLTHCLEARRTHDLTSSIVPRPMISRSISP